MSISTETEIVAATVTLPPPTIAAPQPSPRDLMSRVIAWPGQDGVGFCNLHWTAPPSRGHGVRGRPYKDVDAFMDDVQRMAANPNMYKEIYYCLSTQAETGGVTNSGKLKASRHASKALQLKAIWIDIDCGHGKDYPSSPRPRRY